MSGFTILRASLAGFLSGEQLQAGRISVFDVKGLYDAAYAEKANTRASVRTFRNLLAAAQRLDSASRRQIAAEQLRVRTGGAR